MWKHILVESMSHERVYCWCDKFSNDLMTLTDYIWFVANISHKMWTAVALKETPGFLENGWITPHHETSKLGIKLS